MAKLYPPNLEGKLPAFAGTTMVVPFSMNRAVGASEVYALYAVIRQINRDTVVWSGMDITHDCYTNPFARFDISSVVGSLTIGQYYRVQLAYVDNSSSHDIGYYSSVGVIKYTTIPTVTINDLNEQYSNKHTFDYTGIYSQKGGDTTEKLYSSAMKLWDNDGNYLYESPEVIHSTQDDIVSYEAVEKFNIPYDLEIGHTYKLCFYVTSVNGITARSPVYRVTASNNGGVEFEAVTDLILHVDSNYTRGTVDITISHKNPLVRTLKGMFLISRTEDKYPREWKYIRSIFCTNTQFHKINICDYTVEQGKTYIYAIQQYNNYNLYSNRSYSKPILVDFEDYYLIDRTRQLKIRFNPKISSMQNTVVENKTNTIGSRYPYIIRSGVVNYKEFSLSGLISYHMDDDEDFIKWSDLGFDTTNFSRINEHGVIPETKLPDYQLSPINIAAERIFKLEVLDWLNNGEPKVLKTPTEGNYLVVLMGVNMSPMDQLGRMLHTFQCTASEIGPCDYDTLLYYKFFNLMARDARLIVPQWKTINFSSIDTQGLAHFITSGEEYEGQIPGTDVPNTFKDEFDNITYVNIIPDGEIITTIDIKEAIPNTPIYIGTEKVIIGATGAYYAELSEGVRVLALPTYYQGGGSLVYETSGPLATDFDNIHDYNDKYVCGRQLIGGLYGHNQLADLTSTRNKLVQIMQTRLFKREVIDVYAFYPIDRSETSDNKIPSYNQDFYYDALGTNKISKAGNAQNSVIYDINTPTSLFRINWINYTIHDDGTIVNFNVRNRTFPVEHDDGTISEQSEMYYFYTTQETDTFGEHITVVHEFPVYSGYYFDAQNNYVIEDDFDLYTACFVYLLDDGITTKSEEVNIEEKERLQYDSSFQPIGLYLHDGILADLTYVEQTILYSYEENKYLPVKGYSDKYKQLYNEYMTYVTSFDPSEGFIIQTDSNALESTYRYMTYDECRTELERYRWRVQRTLECNRKLREMKAVYKDLVDSLDSAIQSDLTRG